MADRGRIMANDLLDIEDGVSWIHGSLILCRFTNKTFLVGETHETGRCKTAG
jgi:hypothetical protein